MDYLSLVKNSNGTKETMWKSVEHINDLLRGMKEAHPDIVRKFMEEEYELMNGRHICERLAKEMVSKMFHTDNAGRTVTGEAATPDEAMYLVSDKNVETQLKCKWDAYVGANAFMHDLGKTGYPKNDILKAAKMFWFHDEDMGEKCDKVYWYFKDWIFE